MTTSSSPLLPSYYATVNFTVEKIELLQSPLFTNSSPTAPVPAPSFLYYLPFCLAHFTSLLPWRWKGPPKQWCQSTSQWSITSQKTIISPIKYFCLDCFVVPFSTKQIWFHAKLFNCLRLWWIPNVHHCYTRRPSLDHVLRHQSILPELQSIFRPTVQPCGFCTHGFLS